MRSFLLEVPLTLSEESLDSLLESFELPEEETYYAPTLHEIYDIEVEDPLEEAVDQLFPQTDDFLAQLGLEIAESFCEPGIDLYCEEVLEVETDTETGWYDSCGLCCVGTSGGLMTVFFQILLLEKKRRRSLSS